MRTSLGIDFGTSGARAIVIDAGGSILFEHKIAVEQKPPLAKLWQETLFELLGALPAEIAVRLRAIAINGTSGTVLLCDSQGTPQTEPLLYNDARGRTVSEQMHQLAPPEHTVLSVTSSLSKLLWWQNELNWKQTDVPQGWKLLHQADWLTFLLHGQLGISDYHNALKLGYDPGTLAYPTWLVETELKPLLPEVRSPGIVIGPVQKALARRFNLNPNCMICAGTTDSIAAFLASGVCQSGEAVTSLGSTLVLKLLSDVRVDHATFGIYSHRLGDRWLVGGASNTGGAVLKHFFTNKQLQQLSDRIDPQRSSPYSYYPLLKPGERFPCNDPTHQPCLEPRPDSDVEFLHGLLESMARIEAEGYAKLRSLGATPVTQVISAGGGAQNKIWNQIRRRQLNVPVVTASYTEAAYGTAKLAAHKISK